MFKHSLSFIRALSGDGYKAISIVAPLASLSFTALKAFGAEGWNFASASYAWALLPILVWVSVAYARRWSASLEVESELSLLRNAWDRSGRNLIPIRDAMEIIIQNLRDQFPQDAGEDELRRRAAAKLRQIGWENQIPIWGVEYLEEDEEFRDFHVQISPVSWKDTRIDVSSVFSNSDGITLHTEEDPASAHNRTSPTLYGDLRISPVSLNAAFPPTT